MKILLIEDDKNLCELLQFQLESEKHQVDSCHDGRDGLDLFLQNAHDLVLLDRMLPTMNGLLVLKKARNAGVTTPVILLTALGELYDRIEGLDSGADDYIVKPFEYEELSARIRSLGRRSGTWEEDSLLQYGDITYDTSLRILQGPNCGLQLSGREGHLLEVFLRNPASTIKRMVIFSKVWGVDAPVEESNLDTYIHFLRKRLGSVGSCLNLKTVRGIGYLLEEDAAGGSDVP
ncbi:MAG: response regulator transcription factor [Lachnospiraceae bacterium]|jgi:Response regulators consisting of a CheY-like receiver domain and a winged-helix DNA-binding domain|nr:response regulator transcription factor [Lachnospiraceae bacterium]